MYIITIKDTMLVPGWNKDDPSTTEHIAIYQIHETLEDVQAWASTELGGYGSRDFRIFEIAQELEAVPTVTIEPRPIPIPNW